MSNDRGWSIRMQLFRMTSASSIPFRCSLTAWYRLGGIRRWGSLTGLSSIKGWPKSSELLLKMSLCFWRRFVNLFSCMSSSKAEMERSSAGIICSSCSAAVIEFTLPIMWSGMLCVSSEVVLRRACWGFFTHLYWNSTVRADVCHNATNSQA